MGVGSPVAFVKIRMKGCRAEQAPTGAADPTEGSAAAFRLHCLLRPAKKQPVPGDHCMLCMRPGCDGRRAGVGAVPAAKPALAVPALAAGRRLAPALAAGRLQFCGLRRAHLRRPHHQSDRLRCAPCPAHSALPVQMLHACQCHASRLAPYMLSSSILAHRTACHGLQLLLLPGLPACHGCLEPCCVQAQAFTAQQCGHCSPVHIGGAYQCDGAHAELARVQA